MMMMMMMMVTIIMIMILNNNNNGNLKEKYDHPTVFPTCVRFCALISWPLFWEKFTETC
jgi:hypothetical protein